MPAVPLRVDPLSDAFAAGFAAIRAELGIEDLPTAALLEAEEVVRAVPAAGAEADCRDLPLVTLDPPGSRDLDQALHIVAERDGWTVHYAVADVAAFVRPGGAVDAAARTRGTTVYLPDARSPLHPPALSEGAASLLPGADRQALLWQVRLDGAGAILDVDVRRAHVRSRGAYSYQQVAAALDASEAGDVFKLLREVGRAREAVQAGRGGLDLRLPEQEVVAAAGRYTLVYRAPLPVEGWNAQLSLLVGECAARVMIAAGVGVLRTLPPPAADTLAQLRRHAAALGVAWPEAMGYAQFVRSLDPRVPDHAALVVQSAMLARGAGYLAFSASPPGEVAHAAVGAPYAHVTAPLRRLVDRFANEVALAVYAGRRPPEWALTALPQLPALMERGRTRERAANRMAVSLAEAAVLAGCVGGCVEGVVVDVKGGRATVQVVRPAVVAEVAAGELGLGDEVRLRVVSADLPARRVALEPA